jgi:hypothetical protein
MPTPKEQSTLLCRDDSESEVGGLPAKSDFSVAQCLLFAPVEYGFVAGFSRAE